MEQLVLKSELLKELAAKAKAISIRHPMQSVHTLTVNMVKARITYLQLQLEQYEALLEELKD